MKKIIFGLLALIILSLVFKKEEFVVIPNSAIRIRVISNSNSIDDLYQKKVVKSELESYLYKELGNVNNIEDARKIIKGKLNSINNIIEENGINEYKINYGMNYFPKKVYKGVLYQEGKYESIEIKLGKGIGENYWCVLFPPLCLINENESTSDVTYQLYVKELLKN